MEIEEDEDDIRRRCLPVDAYVQSRDALPFDAPASGLVYLRQVRREAKRLPPFAFAAKENPNANNANVKRSESESMCVDKRSMFSVSNTSSVNFRPPNIHPLLLLLPTAAQTHAHAEALPAPLKLRPRRSTACSADFNALKATYDTWAYVHSAKTNVSPVYIPNLHSREAVWKDFCYPSALFSVVSKPSSSSNHDDYSSPSPLLPVIIHISHNCAIHILSLHISWLQIHISESNRNNVLLCNQLSWIFHLLLCLDRQSLFPEHTSILRDLVRVLKKLRYSWIPINDRNNENNSNNNDMPIFELLRKPQEMVKFDAVQTIVCAIANVFGQHDLADELMSVNEEQKVDYFLRVGDISATENVIDNAELDVVKTASGASATDMLGDERYF
ncbi:hypothetical protein HK100_008577 [Physocladia obscura]|uniref:Uncharacterized protein n=1 Tax=Physocladia obscura TaxID=109957 RepID=A0AAD5TA46_9FUNG|nr:hypothetical protein HK100_008577 [Physocladia obscura]